MVRGLDTNDLILRHSRPARIMRFKNYNPDRHMLAFKIGSNEYGDVGYTCPVEHYEDMMAEGFWETLPEGEIPAVIEE